MAVLHTEYVKQTDIVEKISSVDQDINKYIKQNPNRDFDMVIQQDSRWEVFFHLSELRTSILSWYEFKKGAELLEIGGGFGALTGMFCEKCPHVTVTERSAFRSEAICARYNDKDNLEVYTGDLKDISFKKKFDYIVLAGILEIAGEGTSELKIYSEYLHMISQMLKPDGTLLLATENRYGIRYFCGAGEPHTGRALEGINHYPHGTKGYCFSKQELINIINIAGFKNQKFYYPLPDYKLTQLVYSEEYLPEKNLKERLIPYYTDHNTLLAYENDLYDDLVENHVFEFFANSYLVECAQNENFCSVIYAAISADRGKDNGFATTIHKSGVVKKKALYKEGEEKALKLYERMMDIQARGLSIVPHTIDNNCIIMPYIKSKTLSNYLKEVIHSDKDQFVRIFDRLYDYILSSSEHISSEENKLFIDERRELDWGVILKNAYMELIPLNSFYVDGEILFFDQEFVRENYPAKYVLFRALHYMYDFAPYADKIVPLKSLQQRYQMTELWSIFVKEENKFLADIRKHDLYRHFYKWVSVDKSRMYKNADVLASSDEKISDYKVTEKMKNIWAVQLNLLQAFMDACETNRLKYYIIYGTLLGAVRHKGFIPWDDDVDVAMPREDYNKLKELSADLFKEPYFFQTPENDPDCFYGGFCRLRNSDTTGISLRDIGHDCNQGIWIDIMPLDTCVTDHKKLRKKIKKICKIQNLLYAKIYGTDYNDFSNLTNFKWRLYRFAALLSKHQWLCRRLERATTAYDEKNSEYLAIFTHYNRHQPFDKRDFESQVMLEFAEMKLPAPAGYKRCLEMSVGKDYMTYPPAEERKPHHTGIFNVNCSYRKYKELFFDLFSNCKDKIIIVFGAGLMFEDFMVKYGTRYAPKFIVDNDNGKWGTRRHEIDIKNPEEILKVPEDERRLIICSIHYREIEEQLKQMGVVDYKIYVQKIDWIVKAEEKGR